MAEHKVNELEGYTSRLWPLVMVRGLCPTKGWDKAHKGSEGPQQLPCHIPFTSILQ